MEVPREQTSLYGIASLAPAAHDGTEGTGGRAPVVEDLVEKPDPANAPSTLAVIGRYVLAPEVFDVLATTPPGRGGEIQLTDALRTLAAAGGVRGVVFTGRRYDTGDRLDYLRTVVRLACERDDLGPAFREWLVAFARGLPA
jgi:UTP--glucose-1-phosphate uridylyltransferase